MISNKNKTFNNIKKIIKIINKKIITIKNHIFVKDVLILKTTIRIILNKLLNNKRMKQL